MAIRIDYLANHPQHCQQVVDWVWENWDQHLDYKYEDTRDEFFSSAVTDKLPLTCIALDDDKPIGMIALIEVDYIDRPNLGPWVTDIFIEPAYRNQGIGARLFDKIYDVAYKLGYKKVYLWTEHPQRYAIRPQYKLVEKTEVKEAPIFIYELNFERPFE